MRLAAQHLDGIAQPAGAGGSFDLRLQMRHCRHYELRSGLRFLDQRCRLKEPGTQMHDLGRAAARQQGHHGALLGQPQRAARGGAVGLQRNHAGQRMAHVGGTNAVFGQQLGLEREQAQHVVGGGFQLGQLLGPPGPERRADEVQRLEAGAFQPRLQVEIEIRRIDADEQVGPLGQQAVAQLLADTKQLGQARQHLQVAAHRELLDRPPGLEAARRHLRAADARRLQARPARAQAVEQQARQQIARGFASDKAQAR